MIHLYQNPGILQRNNAQHGNVQNAHTIAAIHLLPQLCFCRSHVMTRLNAAAELPTMPPLNNRL